MTLRPGVYPALLLCLACLLASCGQAPVPPASTPNPDPCAAENLAAGVRPIHDLMRAFDDGVQLAAVVPVDQLVSVVPSLQALRRQAEDLQAPDCLAALQALELQEMNAFINTLLVFIQLRDTDSPVVAEGLAQAQTLHAQYNQELARLLGVSVPTGEATP